MTGIDEHVSFRMVSRRGACLKILCANKIIWNSRMICEIKMESQFSFRF